MKSCFVILVILLNTSQHSGINGLTHTEFTQSLIKEPINCPLFQRKEKHTKAFKNPVNWSHLWKFVSQSDDEIFQCNSKCQCGLVEEIYLVHLRDFIRLFLNYGLFCHIEGALEEIFFIYHFAIASLSFGLFLAFSPFLRGGNDTSRARARS